jgi:hypothetical protein
MGEISQKSTPYSSSPVPVQVQTYFLSNERGASRGASLLRVNAVALAIRGLSMLVQRALHAAEVSFASTYSNFLGLYR